MLSRKVVGGDVVWVKTVRAVDEVTQETHKEETVVAFVATGIDMEALIKLARAEDESVDNYLRYLVITDTGFKNTSASERMKIECREKAKSGIAKVVYLRCDASTDDKVLQVWASQ